MCIHNSILPSFPPCTEKLPTETKEGEIETERKETVESYLTDKGVKERRREEEQRSEIMKGTKGQE